MAAPNTVFSVTRASTYDSLAKHVGYFVSDSYLQIAEWLLLHDANPKARFEIKELNIKDIKDIQIGYAYAMQPDKVDDTFIIKFGNSIELEKERLKIKALSKLSKEEKEVLGLL